MEAEPRNEATAEENVADLLRGVAVRHPNRSGVITAERAYSWSDIDRAADAAVADLAGRGLRPGARVVVGLPSGVELIVTLFALARAGLVAVPLTLGRGGVAAAPVAEVEPALVVGEVDALAGVPRLTVDRARWWTSDAAPAPNGAGGEDLAMLIRAGQHEHPVMLSHRAVLAGVDAIGSAPRLALRADDRSVQVLPLSHLAGWVTAFLPLTAVGAATVIPEVPETSGGWIEAVLATVRGQRVTIVPAAPGLYRRLRTAQGVERALATVRLMTSGASPLDAEDFAGVRSHTGQSVWEGYGIAESASVVSTSLMSSSARPGSVGLPLAPVEIRIVEDGEDASGPSEPSEPAPDPDGEPDPGDGQEEMAVVGAPPPDDDPDDSTLELVADGTVGRIALHGPTLFSGYWPDGRGGPDADGWFVSDDIGYLDDRGELHLVDRAGESLRVAGFTVYPREVEDVLTTHPYVRDAAVIGVPGRAGERMVAVLVAQRGTHPTPEDLDDFLVDRLPAFKRPERYRLVDRLPRSEVGRVDRAAVRRGYLLDPDPEPAPSVRLAGGEAPAEEPAPKPGRGLRVPKPLSDRFDRIARAAARNRPAESVGTAGGSAAPDDELF